MSNLVGLGGMFVAQAVTFAWVLGRVAGFLVVSPFPGEQVPVTARITLALSMSWVVASFASPAAPITSFTIGTGVQVAIEVGCGAAIGFVFRLLLGVSDLTGDMIAHAVGLSTASVMNPESGASDPSLTRAVSLAGLLVAIGVGAHRVALAHVLESFRSLPVGSMLAVNAAGPVLAALAGETLATALRLALPVTAVCLLTQIGLALIARAAPSMQIFNVGLSVTLGAGLLTTLAAAEGLGAGFAEALASFPERVGRVLLAISGHPS